MNMEPTLTDRPQVDHLLGLIVALERDLDSCLITIHTDPAYNELAGAVEHSIAQAVRCLQAARIALA